MVSCFPPAVPWSSFFLDLGTATIQPPEAPSSVSSSTDGERYEGTKTPRLLGVLYLVPHRPPQRWRSAHHLDCAALRCAVAPPLARAPFVAHLTVCYVLFDESSSRPSRNSTERGTLRCEWCNRLTELRPGFSWRNTPQSEWQEIVAAFTPFYCRRPTCAAARKEIAPTPVPQAKTGRTSERRSRNSDSPRRHSGSDQPM